jgi:hypothetical protein
MQTFLTLSPSKSLRIVLRLTAAALLILTLFDCSPSLGQCRNSTMTEFFGIGVLQGKAFVGERVDVHVRAQSLEMDRVEIYKETISRDDWGRIRIEGHVFSKIDKQETRKKFEIGDFDFAMPESERAHFIQLMDCNTNRTFLVNPDHRTVAITELPKPTAAQPPVPPYREDLFQQYANVRNQDLGPKEIAGIRSQGFRVVFPARSDDPAKPFTELDQDIWISREWAVTLKQIVRKHETGSLDFMTTSSFRAEEPNPDSFVVPPDFKAETATIQAGKGTEIQ